MSVLEMELAGQLKLLGVPDPRREFRFHPGRKWAFDFAWLDKVCSEEGCIYDSRHGLAVEVEGGTWSGGRHSRGAGFEGDCAKYNAATLMGWRVLRFTGSMVKSWEAARTIAAALGVKTKN
jgi:hypothetical protein